MSRFSWLSRQTFFVSVKIFKIETIQLRLCHFEIFVEIVKTNWDCQDLLRRIEICQEILTLWKNFEHKNDEKFWQVENLEEKYAKFNLILDRDWDELSRNDKILRSQWTSQSWSRLLGMDIDVETKSRSLDLDKDFSIVKTKFFKMSRFSQLSSQTFWFILGYLSSPKVLKWVLNWDEVCGLPYIF